VPVNSAKAVLRPLIMFVTATVLALGGLVALPSIASAATGSLTGTVTVSDPTYTPTNTVNGYPCAAGDRVPHYRVIQARIVGTSASVLTAKVTPSGFRASLGVYDGVFLPDQPVVNCYGTFVGGSSGAPITYSIPTPDISQFPGITERSYFFVVAGYTASDVGSFSVSVESTNASEVIVTDATPQPADTTKPVLSGLTDRTVEATGAAGAAVTFAPTATDDIDGSRPVTCSPASGTVFALGTTSVSCRATDRSGNRATGSFTVLVRDTVKPVVTVPADIRQQAVSDDGATVAYTSSATDSGSGVVPASSTCSPASGSVFPVGTTTVTCSAKDVAGNASSASFGVTVFRGTFVVEGGVVVDGDATVGRTLTATSTVTTTPSSTTTTGQWLRNGEPVRSATGTAYVLTGADVDATITYRQTDALGGYERAVSTSNAIGPVAKGDIALSKPSIAGTAQVGRTLTVEPGTVAPRSATRTYEWFSGTDPLGTGTTYVVRPTDHTRTIQVRATAVLDGYVTTSTSSEPTAPVAAGVLVATGDVMVSGSATVGQKLTASSTVATTPTSDAPTGQWFRGTVPIPGATAATYVLTNADAGAELTYTETRTKTAYETVTTTSAPTGRISGGVITVSAPVIVGQPVVDQVLGATVSGLDPADVTTSFVWFADDQKVGEGAGYTVTPDDVGSAITVKATTTKPFFDPVVDTSTATAAVQKAVFVTGPSAAITGVFKVGQELTAETGTPSPVQDSFVYAWRADGAPIAGATGKTLTLTAAQKDQRISVTVTARRAGYADSSDSSPSSVAVVTDRAPALTLTPSVAKLRLGQSVTLTWTSVDATSVVASGSWSGDKPRIGTQEVTPSETGTAAYTLTATNGSGTTTAQVAVPVALAPKRLGLGAKPAVRDDRPLRVRAYGLAPGERYTIRLGGTRVESGRAARTGRVDDTVRVPASIDGGRRVLRVTGSLRDRTATRRVRVIEVERPRIVLRDASVRASDRQRVTVSRLLPGERVTVTYQDKRISKKSARASRKGVFTMTFNAGPTWGEKTLKVTAGSDKRSASRTFTVVNRCPQGGYYCR
jgi:hypothetical protein